MQDQGMLDSQSIDLRLAVQLTALEREPKMRSCGTANCTSMHTALPMTLELSSVKAAEGRGWVISWQAHRKKWDFYHIPQEISNATLKVTT
jgi:hypothetical protein